MYSYGRFKSIVENYDCFVSSLLSTSNCGGTCSETAQLEVEHIGTTL